MYKATDTHNVIFMINRSDSDNKCTDQPVVSILKEYSSFVFLVSMKYLKNEEKSKKAAVAILGKLRKTLEKTSISNIKHWLYTETVRHCSG